MDVEFPRTKSTLMLAKSCLCLPWALLLSFNTRFLYIRTSKSGPEAQLFLISTLIVTLLRRVGYIFKVKNNHK